MPSPARSPSRTAGPSPARSAGCQRDLRSFTVTINVTNSKVAIFVLAFFPQFVPPSANAPLQMSILGVVYAGLSLVYLVGVALFAGRVRTRLLDSGRASRAIKFLSGSVLIGFGIRLVLDERPAV